MIQNHIKKYEVVAVAVDVVVFTINENKLKVLLLQLKQTPYTDDWALPGGMVRLDESLDAATKRHLEEKAGVKNIYLEQLASFGEVGRDPRGRVISVAYYALVTLEKTKLKTSDRYSAISWHDTQNLPTLAYDHKEIISTATERLKSKIGYTNIVYALLPEKFTLTDLQKVYEIILNKTLDKRNFRKKILSLNLVKSAGEVLTGSANRPAQLYSFTSNTPQQAQIL